MLSLNNREGVRLCDGVTRREVLRAGGIGLGGLTLPGLFRLQQAAASSDPAKAEGRGPKFGRAKSVILFCTNGGTAQMDSFDPKPDAPAEVRGPYKPIGTSVPGVSINEFLPRLAKLQHKTAMLRAIQAAGRRNYSLFLDDDGLLIGYYETDSVTDADASLAASEVAAAWEAHMQDLFDGAAGRADQTARVLPEVFNLEDQLAAAVE